MTNKPHIADNRPQAAQQLLASTPGWLVSSVTHIILLLCLALMTLPNVEADHVRELLIASENEQQSDELDHFREEPINALNIEPSGETIAVKTDEVIKEADISPIADLDAAVPIELSEIGIEHAPADDLLTKIGSLSGNRLSGRSEKARKRLLVHGGGTRGSEKAVADALAWLANHQLADGGWSFDHTKSPKCRGKCHNPGTLTESRAAATGLALLPFLGAGQTHKSGKYAKTVKAGLYFLKLRMKVDRNGGSFLEPGGLMYSHGIASIAMCEAYAMTKDPSLMEPAQAAVNFICYAQDPVGGGWRYEPQMPGDTSVAGWQIMALKSGHMGYLLVPDLVLLRAYKFLDSVAYDGGAQYGYVNSNPSTPTLTAVGLLCRMYFGWKKNKPALKRGVRLISEHGPNDDVYYNYYATQVMRHWGGEQWEKWNEVMRDFLVESQSQKGHEAGSWYWHRPTSNHELLGGRLYCSAMAAMILEVYYRHLPIYAQKSTDTEFPIE